MEMNYQGQGNPYAPPRHGPGMTGTKVRPDPRRARSMLSQGIAGAVFLGIFPVVSLILGIINWGRAREDLALMEQGLMSTDDGARGKTKAGLALAKVNTIVAPFALISLVLYFWFLIESM